MAIVTGDRYLERLVRFVEEQAGPLIDGSIVLKLNPAGLRYVQSRLEALHELENLLAGAPVDYLRAYVSDLGDHRALEQLRRILRLLTSLKVVSGLPHPIRDPTPLSLLPFGRLRVLELRGCDLSTSAARGLLELRHTLEKIICHNSSDALRHVFASRIVEIKDSPQWHRLSFVSCACNRLVLMDESLQLLPAVETLDLSRNKFAKLDNLRTCSKLKHLDLGFNHLRTISPFNEVSGNLVKLVLRNNALTTLHGLENLKSLEELDVSYNIISNFSEIEFISGLPTLHNLWLEGNPLCCAGWYRAHVFSYFPRLDKLKLDNKEISTRDFWKRQIIIARRQKHPASFGFYSPAKNDAEAEGNVMRKRRKVSRLASIESDEESTCFSSDHESASCDNEVQSKEEHVSSDDKAEIVDLINKVELMKKERSLLWLREFKDWMDHESENFVDGSSYLGPALHQLIEKRKHDAFEKHQGESSKCTANSFHASVSDTNTNVVESNGSFFDLSTSSCGEVPITGMERINSRHKYHKYSPHESFNIASEQVKASLDASTHQGGHRTFYNGSLSPLTAIDDRTESHSSFGQPGSPPHYVEDILQRRHNLVEEILQLSAESYSVVSSDSNTSSSEDENDMHEDRQSTCDYGWLLNFEYSNSSLEVHPSSHLVNYVNHDRRHQTDRVRENDEVFLCPHSEQCSCTLDKSTSYNYDYPAVSIHYEPVHDTKEQADGLERKENKRRLRRRLVSLSNDVVDERIILQNFNGSSCTCEAHLDSEQGMLNGDGSEFHEVTDRKQLWPGATKRQEKAIIGRIADDLIEEYFKENIADASANETCQLYMCCDCVLELESLYREREVALLLSTENKLYVLLIGVAFDGSGHILSLLDWHRMEDVREVLVGVGLQVIRVSIKRGATYLFPTRSIEKSRELLCILQLYGPSATNERCALRSLEQVQVELFEKEIFGGSKVSIFQYSLVLFHKKDREEESWHSRSLFVAGGHVHLCVEDLKHFSSSLGASLPEYFSLDSSCSISGVSELVIEVQSQCVTLVLEHAAAKSCLSSKAHKQRTVGKENKASVPTKALGPLTWKLKWYSEDNLLKFVAVMKAIHAGTSTSSLPVRYVL